MDIFNKALMFVLAQEGGYSNHPSDLGKATNKGITQAIYDTYRQGNGVSVQDVRMIADSEVSDIYRGIWISAACDKLPERLAFVHFDCAVQRGEVKACKMLQDLLGVPADGVIGPKTLSSVAISQEDSLVYNYIDARKNRYILRTKEMPNQVVFLKGWFNRLDHLAKEVNCKWEKPIEV